MENFGSAKKILALVITFLLHWHVIAANKCDICLQSNGVACHSENVLSICVDGEPTYDKITCPTDYVCTASNVICVPRTEAMPICVVTPTEKPTTTITTEKPTTTNPTEEPTTITDEPTTTVTTEEPITTTTVKPTITETTEEPTTTSIENPTTTEEPTTTTEKLTTTTIENPTTTEEPTTTSEEPTTTSEEPTTITAELTTTTTEVPQKKLCSRPITTTTYFEPNPEDSTCKTYIYCLNGVPIKTLNCQDKFFDKELERCTAEKPTYCE